MFLNYVAGAVSLVLAVSAFLPWITVWFYSLKGIESMYGICIFLAGILGVLVAVFQHLSGRMRGRAFISFSIFSLICEGLYFRKMATIGEKLNEIVGLLKDIFGDQIVQKMQQLLGERWTKIAGAVIQRLGVSPSISSSDFIGGGFILAAASALLLLVFGIILEKSKPQAE